MLPDVIGVVEDAISIGLAALQADGVRPLTADGELAAPRLLCDRRDQVAAAGTQAVCRCTGCWPSSPPAVRAGN